MLISNSFKKSLEDFEESAYLLGYLFCCPNTGGCALQIKKVAIDFSIS